MIYDYTDFVFTLYGFFDGICAAVVIWGVSDADYAFGVLALLGLLRGEARRRLRRPGGGLPGPEDLPTSGQRGPSWWLRPEAAVKEGVNPQASPASQLQPLLRRLRALPWQPVPRRRVGLFIVIGEALAAGGGWSWWGAAARSAWPSAPSRRGWPALARCHCASPRRWVGGSRGPTRTLQGRSNGLPSSPGLGGPFQGAKARREGAPGALPAYQRPTSAAYQRHAHQHGCPGGATNSAATSAGDSLQRGASAPASSARPTRAVAPLLACGAAERPRWKRKALPASPGLWPWVPSPR